MKHTSIKLNTPCEFINITPLNPLISKCQIKVCWVGDIPNRNKSIITKEVAKKLANSLPGSPIVGYFNESAQDFETHSKELAFVDGGITLVSKTRPYGFVDLNAKCWFLKFLDDGVVEREYLMTEGYLWTGQYPECKRIIDKGNNQSMELDQETLDGFWTKNDNKDLRFFIINEALISKLCVLGEEKEPCFEGASIKYEFSLDPEFKENLQTMMNQLQQILNKGGETPMEDNKILEEEIEFAKKQEEEEKENKTEEKKDETEKEDNKKTEEKVEDEEEKKKKTQFAKEEEEEKKEDVCPKCGKPVSECTCEEDKKTKYELSEIPEYVTLQDDYSTLQTNFEALTIEKENLEEEVLSLREFKAKTERKEKEEMVKSFYMLSDEDKADVVNNIDTYSLDEIEGKLSIICVRNKVNFNLEDESKEERDPVSYDLNSGALEDNVPAWIRAVRANQNSN